EILNTLRANPHILGAEIVLRDGRKLAGYSRKPGAPPPFDASTREGVYFATDSAELIQNLPDGAHLHLVMSLDEIKRQTMNVVFALAAGLLGLLIAINLGLRATLKRSIVQPISKLADTVEQVRSRADYHQRVPDVGADEVARLARSFNAMMGAVEERDRELRELSLFQKTLLDNAAYGIVSSAPDGTVSSLNPAAERLLGYTAAEIVGKLTPSRWHDPDEVVRYAQRLSEELGETIPPGFETFVARPKRNLPEENEWTFIRKDGTRVPVLLSVTVLRGDRGQITGFLGLVHDLTERKKNEAALREKTEELDRYFTNTLDLLCITDLNGRFRRLNPAWESTLGFSVAELVGRRFLELVHPDDEPDTAQAVSWQPAQNEVRNFTNRYRCKDGAYRWLEWRSFPSGNRIYAVARDVTQRVRAEAELRQLNQDLELRVQERTAHLELANQGLESFSYSVSHDLRAPLRSIDGFSRILLEDYSAKLDAEGQDNLRRIRAASQRMGQLIDDLLKLSRVSRDAMTCTSVDLSALVESIAEELRLGNPQRTIEFAIP
ncbi:MAG TPA: PAS domain S-box protein, partial [Acidobacteriota bacterium]|nr:PAS domain S-box protein [Acidobacteriota bacterium]